MDDLLREQQRALRATPGDEELRARVARGLHRAGRLVEACEALSIRWDVDAAGLVERLPAGEGPLVWRGRPVDRDAFLALVAADLARLDPLGLAAAFPRRADGRWRGNTTRFLRHYPARPARSPHRRVVLLAWTAGTANPPRGWEGCVLCLSLDTRSTQAELLPAEAWGADSGLQPG